MIAKVFGDLKEILTLRSLQARIFIIVLVMGIIPCVVMRYGILDNYEERAVENRISSVQNQLMVVGNHLISNNYFNLKPEGFTSSVSKEVINAELEMISNLYEGRVMIIDSSLRVVRDTYGISEGKTIVSEEVIRCFQGENVSNLTNYDREHGYIEMTTPIIDSSMEPSVIVGVMLTSISNDAIVNTMEAVNRRGVILQNLIVVVVMALAMTLSVLLTRPFNRVTEAIREVKEGYSDESISVTDYAETVHIVDAFNQLKP